MFADKICLFLVLLIFMVIPGGSARALPWDEDMFSQESFQANEMSRAPAKGTVPVGRKPFTLNAEEADKALSNPVAASKDSVWRGQRLYSAQCLTCHGPKGDGLGPIGKTKALPIPNLLDDFYKNRSDGRMFAVIHNGGAAMPRYGYKLSESEHWDIINYLRFLQGLASVPGINRPK